MTLIEKLEAATEGSRELDAEIWHAANPTKYERVAGQQSGLYPRGFNPEMKAQWLARRMADKAPHYTTSLDAALTLKPEGHRIRLWEHHTGSFGCDLFKGDGGFLWKAHAPSLALALCIAALKARTP